MKKSYEIVYVFAGSKSPEDVKTYKAVFTRNMEKFGATIMEEQDWGRRSLAYPIKNEVAGYYYLAFFSIESLKLQKLIRSFKMMPKGVKVMRFLITETSAEEFSESKHMLGEVYDPEWHTKQVKAREKEESPNKEQGE